MELTEVFNFDKSATAISQLEKVLTCKQCKKMYENPRRHIRCGKTMCMCHAQDTKTCSACGEVCEQDLPVDWFLNNIIGAAKTIRKLIGEGNTTDKKKTHTNDHKDSCQELENCETEIKAKPKNIPEPVFKIPDCPKPKVVRSSQTRKSGSGRSTEKQGKPQTSPRQRGGKGGKTKAIMKRNAKGETLLHTACVKGDRQKVEDLLAAGASPCTKDHAGWTPLHEAASKGFSEIVKLLLEWGALVNVPGCYNNTPLHDAALNNRKECAELLMAYGARPDIRNIEGNTAWNMAQTDQMKLILETEPTKKMAPRNCVSVAGQEDPVLFGCGLSDRSQLLTVVRQFKLRVFSKYCQEVTVIVVPTINNNLCRVSIPVLHGILKGNWIVRCEWLDHCADSKELVDLAQYEVDGTLDHPKSRAPRKGRENAQNMLPSLFNGCHFYFCGGSKFTTKQMTFTKTDLKELVTSGGGSVLNREPDPEAIPPRESTVPYHAAPGSSLARCAHFIVYQAGAAEPQLKYNMAHVKSLPVTWFLRCIENFALLEPQVASVM